VELHRRLPARLRVDVPQAPAEWAEGLPGARVVAAGADGVRLTLDPAADPQRILAIAQAQGAVHHFGFEPTSLVDVYRRLVAARRWCGWSPAANWASGCEVGCSG